MNKSFNQHIWNFIHNRKVYMPVLWQYVHWFLCLLQICDYAKTFWYTPSLTSIVFNQSSKMLKFDVLATKAKDHQLAKMVLQVVSIQLSRLSCCWYSWHISKSLLMIKQKVIVSVELAGKLDNETKLYSQLCVLNTCAAA